MIGVGISLWVRLTGQQGPTPTSGLLLTEASDFFLLENGTDRILLEG